MQRRDLLKSAASAAGLTILKSGTLRGQNAPSNKLNIALIGVWGRGTAHYNTIRNENVVALCDVNDLRTKEAVQIFPKAKTYWDWRRCLDQKDVEAVIICTADHHHAFIANWALNRGMHVFCEKPLGITRGGSAHGPRELSQAEGQAGHAARHPAPRLPELRAPARTDPGRSDRRTEDRAWLGRPPAPPARIPCRRRHAAVVPPLRAVDRAVALPSLQPAVLRRLLRPELPVLEHVPGLRRRPDGRHGRAYDGPALERDRRGRAHGHRDRPGGQRQVRPQHQPGEAEGDFRASREQLARARHAGLVSGRPEARPAAGTTSM